MEAEHKGKRSSIWASSHYPPIRTPSGWGILKFWNRQRKPRTMYVKDWTGDKCQRLKLPPRAGDSIRKMCKIPVNVNCMSNEMPPVSPQRTPSMSSSKWILPNRSCGIIDVHAPSALWNRISNKLVGWSDQVETWFSQRVCSCSIRSEACHYYVRWELSTFPLRRNDEFILLTNEPPWITRFSLCIPLCRRISYSG